MATIKTHTTFNDIVNISNIMATQINSSGFKPELIVGVIRGGLLPATMLSHRYTIPMIAMNLSHLDFQVKDDLNKVYNEIKTFHAHNVLFVDDIADTGRTLTDIQEYFSEKTDIICKYAVLHKRHSCPNTVQTDYIGHYIQDDNWVEYPWEAW